MCVALLTTPGKVIDNASLFNGWSSNPHGGGFAYVRDDKVVIEKGFMEYNAFQKAYAAATEKYAASERQVQLMPITAIHFQSGVVPLSIMVLCSLRQESGQALRKIARVTRGSLRKAYTTS